MDALRMETVFDTLVLVHGDMSASDQSELEEWLIQYRHRVNPKLVLADVNVCASESYQKSKYATEGKWFLVRNDGSNSSGLDMAFDFMFLGLTGLQLFKFSGVWI